MGTVEAKEVTDMVNDCYADVTGVLVVVVVICVVPVVCLACGASGLLPCLVFPLQTYCATL